MSQPRKRKLIPKIIEVTQEWVEKQSKFTPFKFQSGPKTVHYTDENGVIWATIEEVPTYEISKTKIVRRKIDKFVLKQNNGSVELRLNGKPKPLKRSVNVLYKKTFNEFEPFVLLDNELWCGIAQFPNIYVSNMGRVLNM